MRGMCAIIAGAVLGAGPVTAGAAVVFSEVAIGGSLSAGATQATGPRDIDFAFPNALVGDGITPPTFGDLTISFVVEGTEGESLSGQILSILGAVSGNGNFTMDQTVTDLTPGNEGEISTLHVSVDTSNPPPTLRVVDFSRDSSKIRVSARLLLDAKNTDELDLSNVSLIEQTFVPAPAGLAIVVMGAIAVARRRRA